MFSKVVNENLELRLVSEKYAEELCSVVAENLEHLEEWLPWATKDYSVDTAKDFIQTNLNGFAKNEFPSFFIFYENKLVGGIGYNNVNKSDQNAEIGYWLKKKLQRNGIVTKCCRNVIDSGFNELNLNRIIIKCATENLKSQAIPERLGFTKEGVARQAAKLNNEFIDLIVYSMLKEEWR